MANEITHSQLQQGLAPKAAVIQEHSVWLLISVRLQQSLAVHAAALRPVAAVSRPYMRQGNQHLYDGAEKM